MTDQPATDQPATDQPAADQPAADRPATADRVTRLRQARFSPYTGPVTNISRRVKLGAAPHQVYQSLTDSDRLSALTGQTAEIGAEPGDPVVLAGGLLTGLVMELLEDRHVVFALRTDGTDWPRHHHSTTTFMLRPDSGGTSLVLFAQAVPEELVDKLSELWQGQYLDRLTAAFPVPTSAG